MCISCPAEISSVPDTEMLAPKCLYPLRQDATAELEEADDEE